MVSTWRKWLFWNWTSGYLNTAKTNYSPVATPGSNLHFGGFLTKIWNLVELLTWFSHNRDVFDERNIGFCLSNCQLLFSAFYFSMFFSWWEFHFQLRKWNLHYELCYWQLSHTKQNQKVWSDQDEHVILRWITCLPEIIFTKSFIYILILHDCIFREQSQVLTD